MEKYKVPYGAIILVADGEKVKARQQLVVWDPHITPILAEKGGIVRYEDIEEGETARLEEERKGGSGGGEAKLVVIEHKGERHPRITIEGADGKILDFHYLPAKARIEVTDGQKIEAGHLLARQPKESAGTMDITGGLPRVTEIFEARKPKDPGRAGGNFGHGGNSFRKTPRKDDHHRPQRNRHGTRTSRSAGQGTSGARRRLCRCR